MNQIDIKVTNENKEEIFSLHLEAPDEILIQKEHTTPGIQSLIKVLQAI